MSGTKFNLPAWNLPRNLIQYTCHEVIAAKTHSSQWPFLSSFFCQSCRTVLGLPKRAETEWGLLWQPSFTIILLPLSNSLYSVRAVKTTPTPWSSLMVVGIVNGFHASRYIALWRGINFQMSEITDTSIDFLCYSDTVESRRWCQRAPQEATPRGLFHRSARRKDV